MRKPKLELPINIALESAFFWPRAEQYIVAAGWIRPAGPRRTEDEKSSERFHNFDRESPLADLDLWRSFVYLGNRGRPAEHRIREWVSRYGLLWRQKNDRDGDTDLDNDQINQKAMMIEEFVREVFFARDLANLYHDIVGGHAGKIQQKINNPNSEVERELADSRIARLAARPNSESEQDGVVFAAVTLFKLQAQLCRAPDSLLMHADGVLCRLLTQRLGGVHLRVVSGYSVPDEVGKRPLPQIDSQELAEATKAPPQYKPVLSWSCQDLLSAIHLQLLFHMIGNSPMRLCAYRKCNTPFTPSRRDKQFCDRRCKEQEKEERKKAV